MREVDLDASLPDQTVNVLDVNERADFRLTSPYSRFGMSGFQLEIYTVIIQNPIEIFFFENKRRAARHYIKREKRMIQFMREIGPKNHTHEASLQRTPKHTIQAQALSNRQPIRRTIGTQGLKTASHLRQNNSKQTLTPGRHASTHSPPNAPRVGE
jgi:hypothetical protein